MGGNASSGQKAYSIKLTEKYLLGEGAFGHVYKIKTKDKKVACAAKIFKIPYKMMS